MLVLFRYACLMEDEGNEEYIGTYSTQEEVDAVVESYGPYFKPSDFFVIGG
jgi:hypothetical protein